MTSTLTLSNYDNYLRSLLKSAKSLNNATSEQCLTNSSYTLELTDKTLVPPGDVSVYFR